MMKLWLDGYAKSGTLTPSVTLSIVAHVIVIGAAVAATVDARNEGRVFTDNGLVRFLPPPDRPAGQQPQREMVRFVMVATPPSGFGVTPQALENTKIDDKPSGIDERDALPQPEIRGEDSVFTVLQVDSAASRYEWSAAPAYP